MKYSVVFLLILGGCATSVDELHRQAQECGSSEACKSLWDSYLQREEWRAKKLLERNITCQPGMVMVVDDWGGSCEPREDVDRWLRRGY